MRILTALFLTACSYATTYTASTGNWSDHTKWSPDPGVGAWPCKTRANNDIVIIPVSVTMHADSGATTIDCGNASIAGGHAVQINGTNSSTYGTLYADAGVTMNLRGYDRASNKIMLVQQYGKFIPSAGSTIQGEVTAAESGGLPASGIDVQGIIVADATGGTPIKFTSPPASYTWGSTYTHDPTSITAAINSAQTTMTLANTYQTGPWTAGSVIYLPSTGEKMLLVSCTGGCNQNGATSITVTRGYAGTAASSALINSTVYNTWIYFFNPAFAYDNVRESFAISNNISNAAGTGPATCRDSSLSWKLITHPAAGFTNEVCSIAEVNSSGKYYVNYEAGIVIYYPDGTGFQVWATYTLLSVMHGWDIYVAYDTDYNSAIFRNVIFNYMGSSTGANFLSAFNKQCVSCTTLGATSNRLFELTNSRMQFNTSGVLIGNMWGKAGDLIKINGNYFGVATAVTMFLNSGGAAGDYISVSSNTINMRNPLLYTCGVYHTQTIAHNWTVNYNSGTGALSTTSVDSSEFQFYDGVFSNNVLHGSGKGADTYGSGPCQECFGSSASAIPIILGSPGHPVVISDNQFYSHTRIASLGHDVTFTRNFALWSGHHGIITYGTVDDKQVSNWIITYNTFAGSLSQQDPGAMVALGYNRAVWVDNALIAHNTCYTGLGCVYFGDGDSGVTQFNIDTRIVVRDNIELPKGGTAQNKRVTSSGSNSSWRHILEDDHNYYYGTGTYYGNYTVGGTWMQGGNPYNTSLTRNILGVALWNPSFAASGGHSLVYTYTSASNRTLVFDGGTAVQLNWYGSGASYTVTAVGSNWFSVAAGLNVCGAGTPFITTIGDICNPGGQWVCFTSGALSGTCTVATSANNSGLVITSTLPSVNDTFVILNSNATIANAGSTATVEAGFFWSQVPTTACSGGCTDSSITMSITDVSGTNPGLLVGTSSNNSLLPVAFAPSNKALATAASDGTTPGAWGVAAAVPIPMRAMVQ